MNNLLATALLCSLTATAWAADVDPFTGQSTAIEQTRSEVELIKEQNDLLQEQTKKAKAEFMLKNADKLFAAELRKQLDQASGMSGHGAASYPAAHFPEPEYPASKSHAGKAAQTPMPPMLPVEASARPALPAGPRLIGTLLRAGTRVSLIDHQGTILQARTGDAVVGLGNVSAIGDGSAVIGGRTLTVETLAVSAVDRQDIKALASRALNQGGGTGGMPPANLAQSAGQHGMPAASFGER